METVINSSSLSLLALSYIIILFACATFIKLTDRIREHSGYQSLGWILWGAFATGCGVWAVNFFGFLAYCLPANLHFSSTPLALSILASMVTCAIALYVSSQSKLSLKQLAKGLGLTALALLLMFQSGMSALNLDSEEVFHYPFISVFITVNLSIVMPLVVTAQFHHNLNRSRHPLYYQLFIAILMAVVFACMHLIGIAFTALREHPNHINDAIFTSTQLASLLSIFSIGIIVSTWFLAKHDQLNSKAIQLVKSLKRAKQDLQLMMMHDPLTRLPNRALLEDRIGKILARAKRKNTLFAVISVDLDRFKSINNTLGHQMGDELIRQVAKRLKHSIRDIDTIARVGGDEFLVAIDEGVNHEQLTDISQRMINAAYKVFTIQSKEIRISLSLGVSLYPEDAETTRELIINADTALYFSKKMGRNNFHFFEPSMRTITEQKKKLEKHLRIAVEEGQLTLVYQPKIDINKNTICGVEALLRWEDAELGTVTPDEFIPLSEEIGLILPLGLWVLNAACQQTRQWLDDGLCSLPVAVNISPYQLNQTGFSELVQQALETSGLPAHFLELEITESAVMQYPELARKVLNKLNQLGVRISIDDFGTGYSNLSQLKSFPIDRLKIDRSFTAGIAHNKQDAAIVKAIIALAHSLNLEVIAEGVETEEQLDYIRSLSAEQYQGYLCSKPLSLSEFRAFISANPTAFNTSNPMVRPVSYKTP